MTPTPSRSSDQGKPRNDNEPSQSQLNADSLSHQPQSAPEVVTDSVDDSSHEHLGGAVADLSLTNGDEAGGKEWYIIHRVYCNQPQIDSEDHSEHPPSADFWDVPRLYASDSRASALRGKRPFLLASDSTAGSTVSVVRMYDCAVYHKSIRESFSDVPPALARQLSSRVWPYASILATPGPLAQSKMEEVAVSQALSTCLEEHTAKKESTVAKWLARRDLSAPYDYFYHFRHQLRNECASSFPSRERKQLLALFKYIDEVHGARFDEIDQIFATGIVRREHFTKLFAPDELIVTFREGYAQAHIARSSEMTGNHTIRLHCWTWSFDGSFQKKQHDMNVSWPQSDPAEVGVSSLSAWPLRLDSTDLRERLIKRGREFWKCRVRRLVSYNAPVPTIFELQVTNPKYMVDYKTYREIHPPQSSELSETEAEMEEERVLMAREDPPDDAFLILLPHTIIGYAFHDKKWRSLHVEHISEVIWNEEAFSRLVLKTNKKETIRALVSVHLTTAMNVDVVENKGNGLIMLLHGSPGTGKTLTAESVAEVAKKPLYRVTCGDVGTSAEVVERYLESVLLLGSIWECVVLLDEADVFLEERQVTDLARNALVSVFLRVLEYYDGILILTTNRVGTFDEAFKSRVQLAIHYPALNSDDRFEIWSNFIDALRDRKISMHHDELKRKAIVLARRPFNGRQIRNSLWTAAQVAKFRQEPLSYTHVEQVVEISQEFEDYLERTHGHSDEENAQAQGVRAV